ncbi:MAG TPA: GDSL-type esterase/lipase family protein [Clostridia bacterium]|nr:GDSL-type esterase/lipase family protein [Clostridia bacterium]
MRKAVKIALDIVIVLILLVAAYFGAMAIQLWFPHAAEPDPDKIRIACVGDSITYGRRYPLWGEKSYPAELEKLLGDEYQVLNYGMSGRTLLHSGDHPYRDEDFFELSQACEPAIVLIMLGTNDSKSYNWDPAAYGIELEGIVSLYKNLPCAPAVYLMAPPAAFVAEGKSKVVYDIRAEVIRDEIRGIVLHVGERTNTPVIDLYAATEGHPEWFSDGVHPTDEGNRAFAKCIYDQLTAQH